MTNPIEVSVEAIEAFKVRLGVRNTPDSVIRLGIRGGACSGYAYVVEFDDDPPRCNDTTWQVDGVKFVIDKKSVIYLSGSRLVFKKTLLRTGFDFENPHEASRCGCGGSFAPK